MSTSILFAVSEFWQTNALIINSYQWGQQFPTGAWISETSECYSAAPVYQVTICYLLYINLSILTLTATVACSLNTETAIHVEGINTNKLHHDA